ncbi:MAG: 16S rRNA (cytidine(1402)-2'-O)-methyltransferase [Bacteroidales bacterium]|jgi:16S rRNA (cytidine1402-2'-O)-methyltransferase|nr:16S rRNA (cytidine(1402)-2'-O)-methyltransferase [Bacteroidales bacterium]
MSKLYIIPTPIGNLEDITLRALQVLKEVDAILAEDTRVTAKLLSHYNIQKKVIAYHQHNEHQKTTDVISHLKSGKTLALVTDAGTPGISDPGFLLVSHCVAADIPIETLPGATAFVPALVNSGLPSDKFFFEGFLPHKKGRQTRLSYLSQLPYTFILYESPHRICKTLEQLIEHCGEERHASVSRELTKLFEENRRGTLDELLRYYRENAPKGEFVVVIEGMK